MRKVSNSSELCWLASRLLLEVSSSLFWLKGSRALGAKLRFDLIYLRSEDAQEKKTNKSRISVIVNDKTARHSLQKASEEKRVENKYFRRLWFTFYCPEIIMN